MSWPATSRLPTRPHSISHKRRKCARSRTREIVPSAKAGSPVDNLRLPPLKTVGFDMSALHHPAKRNGALRGDSGCRA
jgi:hypothetical protein